MRLGLRRCLSATACAAGSELPICKFRCSTLQEAGRLACLALKVCAALAARVDTVVINSISFGDTNATPVLRRCSPELEKA